MFRRRADLDDERLDRAQDVLEGQHAQWTKSKSETDVHVVVHRA